MERERWIDPSRLVGAVVLLGVPFTAEAQAQETTRVSVAAGGAQGNGLSVGPSAD